MDDTDDHTTEVQREPLHSGSRGPRFTQAALEEGLQRLRDSADPILYHPGTDPDKTDPMILDFMGHFGNYRVTPGRIVIHDSFPTLPKTLTADRILDYLAWKQ